MAAILETKGLVRQFGALRAIDHIDLTIEEGELRAIIGPNGAGKSTFFNLVTGFLEPTRGSIFLKGHEITSLRPDQISKRGIARSYQVTNLFPNLTAYENVRIAAQSKKGAFNPLTHFAAIREVDERTHKILDILSLSERSDFAASTLAHGEQRRLEIAIGLASSPILLLLDEPTAGMSPTETDEIIQLIKKISKDLTIIIVEHDMKVVMELAQKISVLHYGKVIAEGPPDEIRNNEMVLEVYLGGKVKR
jgi:branched-chain amino acid transport system ATP-binding protein